MKNSNILNLLFFIIIFTGPITNHLLAQSSNNYEKLTYKAWLKTFPYETSYKGYVSELRDSTILFRLSRLKEGNPNYQTFNINDVEKISFRKNSQIAKGGMIGLLTGVGLGIATGYSLGDDQCSGWKILCYTAEEKATAGGILGGFIGIFVGMIIGSKMTHYQIDGDVDKYTRQKEKIQKQVF